MAERPYIKATIKKWLGSIMSDDKSISMSEKELRDLVSSTVKDTLLGLGIDNSDPIEMQKDFQHLREWRESTDAAKRKGVLVVVTIIISSVLGAIAMGVKSYLGN